jgi:mRNA interferase YafQ
MFDFVYTGQFKRDMKLAQKHGKDLTKIQKVMERILSAQPLPVKHKDHGLSGSYGGRRECHVEPDWLLIYKPIEGCIICERTGTHADLFI